MTHEDIVNSISLLNIAVLLFAVSRFIYSRSKHKLKNDVIKLDSRVRALDFKIPEEVVCDHLEHREILLNLAEINRAMESLRSRIRFECGENSVLLHELEIVQDRLDMTAIRVLEATTLEETLRH